MRSGGGIGEPFLHACMGNAYALQPVFSAEDAFPALLGGQLFIVPVAIIQTVHDIKRLFMVKTGCFRSPFLLFPGFRTLFADEMSSKEYGEGKQAGLFQICW